MMRKIDRLGFSILQTLRVNITALIKKYLAGDVSTGALGQLRKQISTTSSQAVSVVQAGVTDAVSQMVMDGNLRILSKAGAAAEAFTILANVKVQSCFAVGSSGATPVATISGDAFTNPLALNHQINGSTGVVEKVSYYMDINRTFSTSCQILFASGAVDEVAVVYVQPEELSQAGVS